jgi:hypothetical protein
LRSSKRAALSVYVTVSLTSGSSSESAPCKPFAPQLAELQAILSQYIHHQRKRGNYNYYSNYTGDFFDCLFAELRALGNAAPPLCVVACEFDINYQTLWSKQKLWLAAVGEGVNGCLDRRGQLRRRLTDEEEKKVVAIIEERIDSGEEKTDFPAVASIISSVKPSVTSISLAFVHDLLSRHDLVARMTPVKKRAGRRRNGMTDDELEEAVTEFMCDVHDALRKYGAAHVFNMDEKPLAGAPKWVWSVQRKGKKTQPIKSMGSPRRCLTGVVTVSAFGDVLPAVIIKNSKKENAPSVTQLRKDADDYAHHVVLSPSGWMNSQVMIWFLENIIYAHTHGSHCALILDNYGAHVTDEVIAKAEQLHIHLIMMPPNVTKHCQPLDVGVFGPLQKQMDARWNRNDDLFDYVCHFHDLLMNLDRQLIVRAFSKAATSISPQDVEAHLFVLRPLSDGEEALRFIDEIMNDFGFEEN